MTDNVLVFPSVGIPPCPSLDGLTWKSPNFFKEFPDICKPVNERALLSWFNNNVSVFEKKDSDSVLVQQMCIQRRRLFEMKEYASLDDNDKTVFYGLCRSLFTMIGCYSGWYRIT